MSCMPITSLFLRSLMFVLFEVSLHVTYHSDMTVVMGSRLSRVGRPRVQLTQPLTLSNALLPLFLHSIPRRRNEPAYLAQKSGWEGVADKLQGLNGSDASPVLSREPVVTFIAELMEPFWPSHQDSQYAALGT